MKIYFAGNTHKNRERKILKLINYRLWSYMDLLNMAWKISFFKMILRKGKNEILQS